MSDRYLFEETIEPGATWSHVLKRGTAITLTDPVGSANVGAIFYNFECAAERLNIPDSLKAQHIAKFTTGNVLYSDMGRVLASVTADTCGWHDPLGGYSDQTLVAKKYGEKSYQSARNDYHRNTRDGFLIELAKWGLGSADICPCVNFFSKVQVGDNGSMHFVPNKSPEIRSVTLRSEMNVLAIFNTCQHPMDPNPTYAPQHIHVTLEKVDPPAPDDPCRTSCDENQRGFTLTERYFL